VVGGPPCGTILLRSCRKRGTEAAIPLEIAADRRQIIYELVE